jgi:transposase
LYRNFPLYSTVFSFYRRARLNGLWEKVLEAIVEKSHLKTGRNVAPSYGIIDSQSVKTIYAGEKRGIDGGKKS